MDSGYAIGMNLGHDASVALVDERSILYAAAEERFTGVKHQRGFPLHALADLCERYPREISSLAGVGIATTELTSVRTDVDEPRFTSVRIGRGSNGTGCLLTPVRMRPMEFDAATSGPNLLDEDVFAALQRLGVCAPVSVHDHHLCHASAAHLLSPFGDGLVVTSDGRGDGVSATVSRAVHGTLLRALVIADSSSIGQFYGAVTAHLGMTPNRHEGKVLGLSARGNPSTIGQQFLAHLRWLPDGRYAFHLPPPYRLEDVADVDVFIRRLSLTSEERDLLHSIRAIDLLRYKANWFGALRYLRDHVAGVSAVDLAAGIQFLVETATVGLVTRAARTFTAGVPPVALSGGVFANVRVNQLIAESGAVSNVYIQPAMGDDGLAVGAAALAGVPRASPDRVEFGTRRFENGDTYLGPGHTDRELLHACERMGVVVERTCDLAKIVARDLAASRVVGVFQGRMEFGPRALGHRSVLASARHRDMHHELNRRLRRSDSMPFAPSILAECASDLLEGYEIGQVRSECMTSTYRMTPRARQAMPAVAHVDYTLRPHVVHQAKEPFLHAVLCEYARLTGVGGVVNTSFNVHESPIVADPSTAITALLDGTIDRLVLGPFLIVPPS